MTVMDGFVNDFETSTRRGLHAREPDEMVAWDSVVGHHKGLTAVMPVFLRPFKRRNDEEVFEVHRHGIVHGTVVNYNNQVVATKAWNLLAAVADWATAKRKAAEPLAPKPTWRQTFGALTDHATAERARDQFIPSSMRATDEGFETLDIVLHARGFLEAWKAGQWGIVARSLPSIITKHDSTDGARARRAKETYEHSPLLAYEIESLTFLMLSVAVVRASATIGSRSGQSRCAGFSKARMATQLLRRRKIPGGSSAFTHLTLSSSTTLPTTTPDGARRAGSRASSRPRVSNRARSSTTFRVL